MHSQKRYELALLICVAILAALIFFEPSYGWRVRGWIDARAVGAAVTAAPTTGTLTNSATDQSLAAENETLQAQLAALQSIAAQLPQSHTTAISAIVYVSYPFGFKNELLVDAGANEGVATGSAVTYQGIFIGTVIRVFADSALVQTVFDPSFKMPVRVGEAPGGGGGAGIAVGKAVSDDALLVGGADPRATSIAKAATLAAGDVIYTAAPGLPYGLPIGVVAATSTSADNLFQEASVNFIYDINAIQAVEIATQ